MAIVEFAAAMPLGQEVEWTRSLRAQEPCGAPQNSLLLSTSSRLLVANPTTSNQPVGGDPALDRVQGPYVHRLRELVRDAGEVTIATRLGVPMSTPAGWPRREDENVFIGAARVRRWRSVSVFAVLRVRS